MVGMAGTNGEAVPLPVERVHLVGLWMVETLLREVVVIAIQLELHSLVMSHSLPFRIKTGDPIYLFSRLVPDEMVVRRRVRMEKINEEAIFVDPTTGDERIRKVIASHRVVIQAQYLVDFDLSPLNFNFAPRVSPENPQPELSVVLVYDGIMLVVGILLNLLDLDVLLGTAANLFLKRELLSLHRVHLDPALSLICFGHRDRHRGILRNQHRLNRVHCLHL